MNHLPFILLLATLAAPGPPRYLARPVSTPREAKAVAEKATGGIAVRARVIPLNGATGGWEVEVRMPTEAQGWRCLVDRDSHSVRSRTRIPNPPAPRTRS